MARIFITGSSDGLGLLAAKELIRLGHEVVLHARNADRKKQTQEKVSGAKEVLIADLSDITQTKTLAAQINSLGTFDAIIHNAGVYQSSGNNADGLPILFTVNVLAPYILTSLIAKPNRLIYLSSGMHRQGDPRLNCLVDLKNSSSRITYSDTKLQDLILAKTVARKWSDVYSNAVDPGWVPTKMGGPGAPDSLEKGYETQVWLATSSEPAAKVSGHYFHHKKQTQSLTIADDTKIQDEFLHACEKITGIAFPK